MRASLRLPAAILAAALLLGWALPPACAAPNPVPVLMISLEPTSQTVHYSTEQQTVLFNGTVKVEKLPLVRATVQLTSSVDTGWASSVSPSSFVFTDTESAPFILTIIVPQCTPNTTGTVKVDGKVVAGGLVSPATCQCILQCVGAPPPPPPNPPNGTQVNQTGNGTEVNQTGNATSGPPARKWYQQSDTLGLVAVLLVVALASSGYWARRRRRARRVAAGGEAVEVVEARGAT